MARKRKKTVALFATCLVDAFRPAVAGAARALIRQAGFRVETPAAATCCGQPGHNSGDIKGARALAQRHIGILSPYDYVVVPSGSCTGMIRNQYPALFEKGSEMRKQADALARKTYELTAFLAKFAKLPARKTGANKIAYHDSCSCFRELGIRDEPRTLLAALDGAELAEVAMPERCCGFGGLFSVKFGEISAHLAGQKAAAIAAAGADTLAGGDLGCLLNIEKQLKKDGHDIAVKHIAEVLAESADDAE